MGVKKARCYKLVHPSLFSLEETQESDGAARALTPAVGRFALLRLVYSTSLFIHSFIHSYVHLPDM